MYRMWHGRKRGVSASVRQVQRRSAHILPAAASGPSARGRLVLPAVCGRKGTDPRLGMLAYSDPVRNADDFAAAVAHAQTGTG